MRLFVGVYPPEDACAHLAAAVDQLAVGRAAGGGVNARLAPPANWHVTVAFLGEVPDERLDDVRAALAEAVRRWRSGFESPRLWLGGGGRFGRGRFTVLWVGLQGEVKALAGLATAVRGELRRARLPYDHKPMRPHLTLARPGDRLDVRDDLAALNDYAGPAWTASEVRLMRSHLGPRPTYDTLAGLALA